MEKWARLRYQPNLPLGEDGSKVTASSAHINLSRQAAADGMVLLKNEQGALPLQQGERVALFGKATIDYVQGGGGSGEVHCPYQRNLYEGLQEKGNKVQLFHPLVKYYQQYVSEQYAQGGLPGMTEEAVVPQNLFAQAKEFANTAIISICRFSGEGWDRKAAPPQLTDSLWANIAGPTLLSMSIFKDGDFILTPKEKDMISQVTNHFEKVIVVINAGGLIDSQWFHHNPAIQGALMAWAPGMEGGLAMADILVGDVCPSGKLADTMAKSLEDYPSTEHFHQSQDYVTYQEDIFVGYRYFETVAGAKEKVNYPFGFGLSYTNFRIRTNQVEFGKTHISLDITVTNIGSCWGKEVVQVYVEAPQQPLTRPKKQLVAFEKTKLLAPQTSVSLTLKVAWEDFAAYDDIGLVNKSSYVLQKGIYQFYVGNSVDSSTVFSKAYQMEEHQIVAQLSAKLCPQFPIKRMTHQGIYEEIPAAAEKNIPQNILEPMTVADMECRTPPVEPRDSHLFVSPYLEGAITLFDVANGNASLDDFMTQLSDRDLMHLVSGQPNTGVGITFGFGNMPEYGVPTAVTADGPAGLRVQPETGVATTAWPCATALACTWDREILYAVGSAGAAETKENNLGIWMIPGINIHRTPLCGRNFEYFSEDPFLTGKLAAFQVSGIQSRNISACVKHLAFNNKETNRKYSDSRMSERAAREIYLKAFEIVAKESDPWAIMSSYNIINGVRCGECTELLTDILREEWGFDGLVTTDWWAYSEAYLEILAGNDIKMGCGYPKRLAQAKEQGAIQRKDLEICAKRVLELILKLD